MENAQRAADEQLAKMRATLQRTPPKRASVRDGVGRSRGGEEGTRGDPEGGRSVRSGEEGGGRRRAAAGAAASADAAPPPVVADAPLVLLLGAEGARDELCALLAPRIARGCCGRATRGGGDYGGERGGRRAARPHA